MFQEILGKLCYNVIMPELPEVETVCRQLEAKIKGEALVKVESLRKDLRSPLPKTFTLSRPQKVLKISRRSKYILIELEEGLLLSHLGMTGAWRFEDLSSLRKHDHVILHFERGSKLVYNDPRRFGVLEWIPQKSKRGESPWLKDLGPEPLSEAWTVQSFFQNLKRFKVPVKVALMNPKLVVGVGNIYASEILFRAGVRPTRRACRITQAQAEMIFKHTRIVLEEAILAGGSTIENYKNLEGQEGGFQQSHKVYGRESLPCCFCHTPIRAKVIGGRSTFWCPTCQRA